MRKRFLKCSGGWLKQMRPRSSNHPTTIADLVKANMTLLKRCGVKNLQALATGKVLPTPEDFAIITSALPNPESERLRIWQRTFS